MTDDIDMAQERELATLALQLAVRKPEGPPANGRCLTCDTPLSIGLRWCDPLCRDEFDRSFISPRR